MYNPTIGKNRAVAPQPRHRGERGQGLVLGVLVTMILAALIAGGAMLLASMGMAAYYQTRFNGVANATARFAVNCNYWLGAQRPMVNTGATDTSSVAVAKAMLAQMGVSSAQSTVTVDQSQSTGCVVTIAITGLPMLHGLTSGTIDVTSRGFEPWLSQAPIAVEGLAFTQNAGGYYMPSYGAGASTPGPSSTPAAWNLVPYWENGCWSGLNPRVSGPVQNVQAGPACTSCY